MNSGDITPSSGDASPTDLEPPTDLPGNDLEVEMPRRFTLEFQTDDGEWMDCGAYPGVSSSAFLTAATSAAPTHRRC